VGVQAGVPIEAEIATLAAAVASEGIKAVVIDTQRNYLSRGEGRKLAEKLSGEYIYLPNATGADIAATAVSLA
jgi:magnesium chelatase subunit D